MPRSAEVGGWRVGCVSRCRACREPCAGRKRRWRADEQLRGDLWVGGALAGQAGDERLLCGQGVDWSECRAPGGVRRLRAARSGPTSSPNPASGGRPAQATGLAEKHWSLRGRRPPHHRQCRRRARGHLTLAYRDAPLAVPQPVWRERPFADRVDDPDLRLRRPRRRTCHCGAGPDGPQARLPGFQLSGTELAVLASLPRSSHDQ